MKFTKRKMSTKPSVNKQESKGPSLMGSLAHGAATGVGIGAGIEGVKQVSNAMFGDKPEEKSDKSEEKSDCEFLKKMFTFKCDNSDDNKELCNQLFDKINLECNNN